MVHCHKCLIGKQQQLPGTAVPNHLSYSSSQGISSSTQLYHISPSKGQTFGTLQNTEDIKELVGTTQRQIRSIHTWEQCEGERGEGAHTVKCAVIYNGPCTNLVRLLFWFWEMGKSCRLKLKTSILNLLLCSRKKKEKKIKNKW